MRSIGKRAVVTALIAAAALCGPLAQSALADEIAFLNTGRQLVMTGTSPGPRVLTVEPGTPPNEYRFTSTTSITVLPSANAFCGPTPALVVECDDDPTGPGMPADDILLVRVDGAAGVDTITASGALDSAVGVLLDGGDANDILNGGVRPEVLSGGPGNDTINGGPGADFINGDAGSDTIEARDGVADTIRCGTDTDGAFADSVDTFPGSDCESTTIGFPTPPPPPQPPPPLTGPAPKAGGPPIAIGVSAAFEITRRGTRVRRLTVRDMPAGIVVHVTCTSPSKRRGGARCPFKLATIPLGRKRARLALSKRFKSRRLAPHTVIRVFGAAPGRLGTSARFTLRKGRAPSRSDGCVSPALKRISCLSAEFG